MFLKSFNGLPPNTKIDPGDIMKSFIAENIESFIKYLDINGPLLGLDLGTKTIGVAISDPTKTIATSLCTIKRKKFVDDLNEIIKIDSSYSFSGIVLGLPINMNGTEGPRCQSTRAFAEKLSPKMNLPLYLWDERLSTVAAEKILLASDISRKSRSKVIDKIAACYILQGFLDRLKINL